MFKLNLRGVSSLSYAALIVALMFIASPSKAQTLDVYHFNAFGGSWAATEIVWVKIEKKWLVSATILNTKQTNRGLKAPEMFAKFCEQISSRIPYAPTREIDTINIFRVDLNLIGPNGAPIAALPVPIPVSNGKCQVNDGSKDYSPIYPGRLTGWQFIQLDIQKSEDWNRIQWTFEQIEGVEVEKGSFDFAAACEAARLDPSVQNFQKKIEERAKLDGVELQTNIVSVILRLPPEPGENLGLFFGYTYDTSTGTCVEVK
jgi:hypothetical protein